MQKYMVILYDTFCLGGCDTALHLQYKAISDSNCLSSRCKEAGGTEAVCSITLDQRPQ